MAPLVPNVRLRKRRRAHESEDFRVQVRGLKWTTFGVLVCIYCINRVSKSISIIEEELIQSQPLEPDDPKWVCQWRPEFHDECNELLMKRLPPPHQIAHEGNEGYYGPKKQRWLFFGDSTMKRQFTSSNLDRHLVGEPIHFIKKNIDGKFDPCWTSIDCEERSAQRCDMAKVFGFKRAESWRKPKFYPNFEGPVNYGLDHPDCSDCGGCWTQFLHCSKNKKADPNDIKQCTKPKLSYGGFIKVEFAKDVELQTEHFDTTQENTAMYLREHFNTPELVEEWGKPICVILTGFHDMILLIKTQHFKLANFVDNVEWYLHLMQPQCSHIIWLTNTAPSVENPRNWPQTVQVVKDWNDGVRNMIEQNKGLRQITTIIDVYVSSLDVPNKDHVHMIDEWYNKIGHFFSALITERPVNEV